MSEHIVHTAVLEDAFALGVRWPRLSAEFRRILSEQLPFALLGCITVSGDRFSFKLLERFKKTWPAHPYEDDEVSSASSSAGRITALATGR